MKRKIKKITAVFLIFLLAGSLFPAGLSSQKMLAVEAEMEKPDEQEPVFHYKVLDKKKKTIAITKIDFVGESLVIPENLDGYTVVQVGSSEGKYYTQRECRKSKYDSLIYICNYALSSLFEEEEEYRIDFPEKESKLHVLPNEAGKQLTHLELPKTLKTIGGLAFQNCPMIEAINLPKGIEYIHAGAFQYNEKASKIVIPKSVKKIGARAFDTGVFREVKIKSSKVLIGKEAFSQYGRQKPMFQKLSLPEKVSAKQLKKDCFSCYLGKSFVWPDCSGKDITTNWFGPQWYLKNVKISKYAKRVVFGRCVIRGDKVKSVTIPARVKEVVVKQQPTTLHKLIFKGKNTKLTGDLKMGLHKNKTYISVAKVVAPRNAKAFRYAKKARYPSRFWLSNGDAAWIRDPMNYYTEEGERMKKVKCVVKG